MNHKTILTTAQEKNMPAFVQKMTQPFQFDPRSNTKTNSTENKESKDDGTANVGVAVDTGDKAVKTNCYQAEFNNYLSFGVDAQIMTDFHEHRESHRDCYPCR